MINQNSIITVLLQWYMNVFPAGGKLNHYRNISVKGQFKSNKTQIEIAEASGTLLS